MNVHDRPSLDVGCVNGRFQPPHKGHLEYLSEAKKRCAFLWIGICRPTTLDPTPCEQAPHRGELFANPLSYEERVELITTMMRDHSIPLTEFACMPFPIDQPSELMKVLPRAVKCFVTVYEPWNREKVRCLSGLGYQVEVLYERPAEQKLYIGTTIRESMLGSDDAWQKLVPEGIVQPLLAMRIPERVRDLASTRRLDEPNGP